MAKTIVITGVTRGSGRGLAGEFDRLGHKVSGCGRSNDQVAELQTALGQARECRLVLPEERRLGQQVARRIAAQRQLRQHNQLCAGLVGAPPRIDDFVGVSVEIANGGVDL